ncbi:MAG: hypothetical protein AAGC67_18850 [Myxococcota bacterium]
MAASPWVRIRPRRGAERASSGSLASRSRIGADGRVAELEEQGGGAHAGRVRARGPFDQEVEASALGEGREARRRRAGLTGGAYADTDGVIGQHEQGAQAFFLRVLSPQVFGPDHDVVDAAPVGVVLDRRVELDQPGAQLLAAIVSGRRAQRGVFERGLLDRPDERLRLARRHEVRGEGGARAR